MRFGAFVAAIFRLIALIAAGPPIHAAGRSISGIAVDESGGVLPWCHRHGRADRHPAGRTADAGD